MVADTAETSVDDATRRITKFLISPELAVEYNMLGRHGGKKFRYLRLFNVVYEALKNYLTSKVNLQEAEKALSKWFKCGPSVLKTEEDRGLQGYKIDLRLCKKRNPADSR